MTTYGPQVSVPATFMRGGTSKGLFFKLEDLPKPAQAAGAGRDRFLLRLMGSPDPYEKQIDGMGGASSSTSKVVILCRSSRPDHDIDYLFGQVAIDQPIVDWTGNCGNLSAAVGPFAISSGLLPPQRVPRDGVCVVRIWQQNIGKTIIAHVPMLGGQVQETGDFELDGVTFPAAEIPLEFMDPGEGAAGASDIFPTGRLVEDLEVPGVGSVRATLINAGIPTVFLNAADVGYDGTELQPQVNTDPESLARFEAIRAQAAIRMGLVRSVEEAGARQHTPKIAFVAPARAYTASSGKRVGASDVDLLVRALSMGKLHHAMMGTVCVAIASAAAIPGTLVNQAAGGGERQAVRFGHPSGSLRVGAEARERNGEWVVTRVMMSRSARMLMEGRVHVPDVFES